jgi:hypothetical protein
MPWSIESYIQDAIAKLEEAKIAFAEKTVEACDAVANMAVETISKKAPFDEEENNDVIPGEEGHLNESFYAIQAIATGDGQATTSVNTNEPIKFEYVTEGTMDKSPIRPVVKKALFWPALEHPVASVKGQEPDEFFNEAYDEIVNEAGSVVDETFAPVIDMLRLQ